jgi:hypothetical protein
MFFDLDSLLVSDVDLGALEVPFTHSEIDNVIKIMAYDKSPSPDGSVTNS